ncbi:hypothetical protein [Mycolicibacterium gilvum]|uniref:hypothetical protein n=1 Tax=Mycolicibacterium gilvum TaxID=1804 RepID=UPI0040458ECC
MSVLELPEPPGWRAANRIGALAAVVGLAVAAAYLYWAVMAAVRGNYLTTVVALGPSASIALMVAAVGLVLSGRISPRTSTDATGFTVWPDRRFSMLILGCMVVFIPSGVLFSFLAPQGLIDLPLSTGMRTFGSFAAGVVALIGAAGLVTAWRRGGVGHVKLTPAMVENADIFSTRVFEWDDVVDVVDHAETRRARRAVVLRLRDGREEIISVADIYLPRGVALYWLVRHYWRHPEDRMELVDNRVTERLKDGRFDLG